MTASRTYLDWNATAPLRPEALAAMSAALDVTGNPSSVHAEGRRARALIEDAREQIAGLVGARPAEIVFTSGATEANNWAIRGGWPRLFVGPTEHESVLAPAHAADPALTTLACGRSGLVELDSLVARPLSPRGSAAGAAGLVSLQMANSETGVIQPIAKLVDVTRSQDLLVHSDAVQAVGRIPVDFRNLGLDLMSISAHKLGGPKGVGALVVREGIELSPLLAGGGQERRRRAGTENVAAIAGFGAAACAAVADHGRAPACAGLRDRLEAGVLEITPAAVVIGADAPRLPNTSCIALPGAQASTLLIKLDLAGIAISAGSACSSGKIGGSHVLSAMGVAPSHAAGAIRISLGHTTTIADVDRFLAAWRQIHLGSADRNDRAPAPRPSDGAAPSPHFMSAGE